MDLRLGVTELNGLLSGLAPLRRIRTRFLFAPATVIAALLLTAVSQWLFGSAAAAVFALTVIVSTSLFGLQAGLCATVIAVLTLDFFYVPPLFQIGARTSFRECLLFGAMAGCTNLVQRRISAGIRSKVKPPLGIQGYLDGLKDGEISGWAFDADHPEQPVGVTVLVDKHPVAHVLAVHYRPDVAEIMNCSGRHGFYVDLAQHFQGKGEREAVIDVRLANGNPLTNAPSRVKVPALTARRTRPTVLFMHIPKTAGTAFREAIAANFLQSEIAYLYPTPPGFLVTDLRALPLEQRRGYRMVMGHYQFGMHEALPQESEYITFVREPAARVLSQYDYDLQHRAASICDRDGRLLSLDEVFEKRLTVDFDNALVRCFSGIDERDLPPGSVTAEIYEQAVCNLLNSFAFVGHQEASAEAYNRLRGYYGWHATEELPIVNVGRPRATERAASSVTAVIRHFNSWDYLLYEQILRVFPMKGGSPPRVDTDHGAEASTVEERQ